MASLSALRASTVQALRTRLEVLDAVERVLVDEERGSVWIVAGGDVDHAMLEEQARAILTAEGEEADTIPVEVAATLGAHARHRVRFVGVQRFPAPEGHVRMRVTLEWDGVLHTGEELGETSAALEMRTAALATVRAVQALSPDELRLRLIGVKQIRAFDQEITVVSIFRESGGPLRLVGAVLTTEDPLKTAALAVLSALNRILGNYLSTIG